MVAEAPWNALCLFNVDPSFLKKECKKVATFDSEYISKMTPDGQPGTPTEVCRIAWLVIEVLFSSELNSKPKICPSSRTFIQTSRRERELRVLCKESSERVQHRSCTTVQLDLRAAQARQLADASI